MEPAKAVNPLEGDACVLGHVCALSAALVFAADFNASIGVYGDPRAAEPEASKAPRFPFALVQKLLAAW